MRGESDIVTYASHGLRYDPGIGRVEGEISRTQRVTAKVEGEGASNQDVYGMVTLG